MRPSPHAPFAAARGVLLTALLLPVVAFAAVDPHRISDTMTGWRVQAGLTASELAGVIDGEGLRIIDLEIDGTAPLTFTASLVSNSGEYASGWWWQFGMTFLEMVDFVDQYDGRLIDFERYVDGGQERWAAVMVPNSGSQAKTWWYLAGTTPQQLADFSDTNNARIVDLESWDAGGTRLFAAILIRNTGEDATGWGWYHNITASALATELATNDMRILEYEMRDPITQRVDAVVIPNSYNTPLTWWWQFNLTLDGVGAAAAQAAARITDVEVYDVAGNPRYAVVMVSNATPLTVALGTHLGWGSDGSTGAYLREIGGAELAALQPDFVFEPASSLKALHLLRAMRDVAYGPATLDEPITYSVNYFNSCPIGGAPFVTETYDDIMEDMMWNSDNAATRAIADRYGFLSLNVTAAVIAGMQNTEVNHHIGCGAPPNETTLRDLAELYERVETEAILDAASRQEFFANMLNENFDVGFGASLRNLMFDIGGDLGFGTAEIQEVWDQTRARWKPGVYIHEGMDYISQAGIVSLPDCSSGPDVELRDYLFGVFVHGPPTGGDASSRTWSGCVELFRDVVAEALESCATVTGATTAGIPAPVLAPAAPNPFNPTTQLTFELPAAQMVNLTVYDARGRQVAVLARGEHAAGRHTARWNGRDEAGRPVPAGIYFARLESDGTQVTRKLALVK
jgi:hypothetical protein